MRGYSGVPGGFRRGAARAIQAQRLQLVRGTAGPHGVYGGGLIGLKISTPACSDLHSVSFITGVAGALP